MELTSAVDVEGEAPVAWCGGPHARVLLAEPEERRVRDAKRGVLEGPVDNYLGLLGLGLFGPLVGAMILSRREAGGIRGLFAQLGNWRVHPSWYVLALPGALMTAGMAVYQFATGDDPGPWTYFPTEPERVAALLLIPFTEEIGWRGYALPRLQALTGRVWAVVILGALWGLWHIPMFVVQDLPLSWMPLFLGYFVAGSVTSTGCTTAAE